MITLFKSIKESSAHLADDKSQQNHSCNRMIHGLVFSFSVARDMSTNNHTDPVHNRFA